ncbi:hypothetical protein FXO37_29009 [Capsicum annuum]|nr:hypothetical protein FXO37_29009 [Capsicum annuum]
MTVAIRLYYLVEKELCTYPPLDAKRFDGNSINVAELLVKNDLKEAYAIRGGIRGKKGWQNNDEDAEKFAILYFLHSFVLSNVETVVIPHLHFDLVDSGRYKDFPWGSLSFEDLTRSLNNRLKADGQFYLIQKMPLAIQVWLYECCSNVPLKIASKVDNRIFRLLNWKTIARRPRFEFLMNAMSNDHGKDPPPKMINEHSKKKQKVDSSIVVAKKPLRKKQVNIFYEHTQTRTPTPRDAKADGTKTPVFKSIPTRQASSSKTKKEKQTAWVIFPQVQSKLDIHVEKVALSKPEIYVEKKGFISKKDFDAFRDEEQVVDIEADKPNIDEGGLEQSGQYFSPDVVQSSDNISDGTKQQHADEDPNLHNMDYVGTKKSPQRSSSEIDQKLEANFLGTKTSDEKINETILSDSQFTIPDEMLPSLNAYRRQSIIIHLSANHQEESHHEILNAKTSETFIEDPAQVELTTEEQVRTPPNTQEVTNDEQRNEQLWPDSQNTIPDEFLPSLNHIDVCLYYLRKKSKYGSHSSYKNKPNKSYKYSTVDCNFMNVIRSLMDVYSMDHQNLNVGGQEHHFIEYISMHAAVPWHTVEDIFIPVNIKKKHHWVLAVLAFSERCIFLHDSYKSSGHYAVALAEIEKIVKIIPLCLQACDFYVKKGIDLQNHPRYKDKESSDMFDVLFEDDLPQQLSGSLDCGVFMVMYAECLSYGHKVIATEFDPNALRTRYAALLWDYGIRKQEANSISDVEAPLRPARQSRITSVTEVFDIRYTIMPNAEVTICQCPVFLLGPLHSYSTSSSHVHDVKATCSLRQTHLVLSNKAFLGYLCCTSPEEGLCHIYLKL